MYLLHFSTKRREENEWVTSNIRFYFHFGALHTCAMASDPPADENLVLTHDKHTNAYLNGLLHYCHCFSLEM